MPKAMRRVVTGINEEGLSCILSDIKIGPGDANVMMRSEEPDLCMRDYWRIKDSPTTTDADETTGLPFRFPPATGGLVFRIADIPPESKRNYSHRAERLAEMGKRQQVFKREPHPGMHETDTIDLIIVMSGRVKLILEEGETLLSAGDVVIQRGTNHAWSNPDDEPAVIAAIMVDAKRVPGK